MRWKSSWMGLAFVALLIAPVLGEGPKAAPEIVGPDLLRDDKGEPLRAWTVSFTPDGKQMLTGGPGTRLTLRDVATGAPVRALPDASAQAFALALPGGRAVADLPVSATREGVETPARLGLFDLATGSLGLRFGGTRTYTTGAASPDGRRLAAADTGGVVRLFDLPGGAETRAIPPAGETAEGEAAPRVHGLAFAPDGKTLAIAAQDGKVRLVAVESGAEVRKLASRGRVLPSFTSDGKAVVWVDAEEIVVHPVTGGGEARRFRANVQPPKHAEPYPLAADALAPLPGGSRALLTTAGEGLYLLDLEAGRVLGALGGARTFAEERVSPAIVVVAADGRTAAIARGGAGLELHRRLDLTPPALGGHDNAVYDVAFTPDGAFAVSVSDDNTLRVWDAATGKEHVKAQGPASFLYSGAVSPLGKVAAAGLSTRPDAAVILFDILSGTEVRRLAGAPEPTRAVAFSPDGKHVAAGSFRGALGVWEVATGKSVRSTADPKLSYLALAYTPDGKVLAAGATEATLLLLDPKTLKPVKTLKAHEGGKADQAKAVRRIAAFAGGLATCGNDGTIATWTLAGALKKTWKAHENDVYALAASPDGKVVASGGREDPLLRLWDAATGRPIATYAPVAARHFPHAVAFSKDGKRLVVGYSDGEVRILGR